MHFVDTFEQAVERDGLYFDENKFFVVDSVVVGFASYYEASERYHLAFYQHVQPENTPPKIKRSENNINITYISKKVRITKENYVYLIFESV